MSDEKRLFEPGNPKELLRGWLLHAHKGRDRHDVAARRFEGRRYSFGVPAIVLSAVVGTSVFSSLGQGTGVAASIIVGLLSVTATVLAALQTFLDYPGRAARHRVAGAKYKALIRELEQVLAEPTALAATDGTWLTAVRARFDTLEEDAPVVAPRIYDRVEQTYANVKFVGEALALYDNSRARAAG
jgi:hypothetical protein